MSHSFQRGFLRRRRMWGIVAVSALGVALVGCGNDSKQPSNVNFQKLIRAEVQNSPDPLTYLVAGSMWESQLNTPLLLELVKLGILNEDRGPGPNAKGLVRAGQGWQGIALIIGVADPESVEVLRFSEPASSGPARLCRVEYAHAWRPSSLIADPQYASLLPLLKGTESFQKLHQRANATEMFELYSDGWRLAD